MSHIRPIVSKTVNVKSMLFDFPRSKQLSKFEAAVLATILHMTLEQLKLLKYTIPLHCKLNAASKTSADNSNRNFYSPVAEKLTKDR